MRRSRRSSAIAPRNGCSMRSSDRAEGNPFFVEELLASGAGTPGDRLPPTLRDVLLTRFTELSEDAQRILGYAAVAGRTVESDLLADVAEAGEAEIEGPLREAVAAQILTIDRAPAGGVSVPACAAGGSRLRRPAPERAAPPACSVRCRARCAARPGRRRRGQPHGRARAPRDGGARAGPSAASVGASRPRHRRCPRLRRRDPSLRAGDRAVGCRPGGRSSRGRRCRGACITRARSRRW